MNKLIKFLKDYARGDESEVEFFFTWPKFAIFLVIVGLIIYIIWK